MRTVGFTRMQDGTKADFDLLEEAGRPYVAALADRVLATVRSLEHGFEGYRISSLDHLLQSATRAERDGADEELVFATLLHDIGDVFAPHNHAAFAAAFLRPYVREEVHWIVKHHHVFQLFHYGRHVGVDPELRERFRGHPSFYACAAFCERWDQTSFDPGYAHEPLEHFEPLVRRILARGPIHAGHGGA